MSQRKSIFSQTIHRPVSTLMLFTAIAVLGFFSWARLPIELIPSFQGDKLYVHFYRPGAEPEVVERDILQPLESRVKQLAKVTKTTSEIYGTFGTLTIEFGESGNYRVREVELKALVAELAKEQPEGSRIRVATQDTSSISQYVMSVQLIGDDLSMLNKLAKEKIEPIVSSTPNVGRVIIFGGREPELRVAVDPKRSAELGITIPQVVEALERQAGELIYLGDLELTNQNFSVIVDSRLNDENAIRNTQVIPDKPVLLRHIAEIALTSAPRTSIAKVNGKSVITLVIFQDNHANLIKLGEKLRKKISHTKRQLNKLGLDLIISFDASKEIKTQLDGLYKLAISGFVIALAVLFLFLKNFKAVLVIAIAVPMSLLTTGILIALSGLSLNIITLFGLVIGIGMLVDNSIVVHEAIKRKIDKGLKPQIAVTRGLQKTIKAIVAASITNGIVFLPIMYLSEIPVFVSGIISNLVPSIIFPLAASLFIATTLVPLLTYKLLKPSALPPKKTRFKKTIENTFNRFYLAYLKQVIRTPLPLFILVSASILVTIVVALPWVLVNTANQSNESDDRVRLAIEFAQGETLNSAELIVDSLQNSLSGWEGISRIESNFNEDDGTITVYLDALDKRPEKSTVSKVRSQLEKAADKIPRVQLKPMSLSDSSQGNWSKSAPSRLIVSGPEMIKLKYLSESIKTRLESIDGMASVYISSHLGHPERHISADQMSMEARGVTPREVYNSLAGIGKEGLQIDGKFNAIDSTEIPIVLRRNFSEGVQNHNRLNETLVTTENGIFLLAELAKNEPIQPQLGLSHRNGYRQLTVEYNLNDAVAKNGPQRATLENRIQTAINSLHVPEGYYIEFSDDAETTRWLEILALPIILLLYAILAMTFESVALPFLIVISIPLTILGSIWSLVLAGLSIDIMAAIGVLVLLGLSINPAILLVERMQSYSTRLNRSRGAGALIAARERAKPILMTSATTIASLWPLTMVSGGELELWPPFATIVVGGLITSSLLTLLVVPAAFVVLSQLESKIKAVGWQNFLMAVSASAGVVSVVAFFAPFFTAFWLSLLFLTVLSFSFVGLNSRLKQHKIVDEELIAKVGIETRFLSKVYGKRNPVMAALSVFIKSFNTREVTSDKILNERAVVFLFTLCTFSYLGFKSEAVFWQFFYYLFASASLFQLAFIFKNLASNNKAKTFVNQPNFQLNLDLKYGSAWLALLTVSITNIIIPYIYSQQPSDKIGKIITLAAVIALFQLFSRPRSKEKSHTKTLQKTFEERNSPVSTIDRIKRIYSKLFPASIQPQEFIALNSVNIAAKSGMVGILGPNGAGKTTLFRVLANILVPSSGTIKYCSFDRRSLASEVSKLVGFLPQYFGLPGHMTCQEYLEYFASLYKIGNSSERAARIAQLLTDVGLDESRDQLIASLSGGMKQRVAIARTLLRKPPIIIVDEPTVGLDPRERIRFRNLLKKIAQKRLVLFSTHIVEDVAVSCERVIVLKNGSVVFDDSPEQLAALANNKIWQVILPKLQASHFEQQFKVINQVQANENNVNLRVLSEKRPHIEADGIESTLEDGYFQLFHEEASEKVCE